MAAGIQDVNLPLSRPEEVCEHSRSSLRKAILGASQRIITKASDVLEDVELRTHCGYITKNGFS